MRVFVLRLMVLALGIFSAALAAEVVLRLLDIAPTDGVSSVTTSEFEAVPGLQDLLDRLSSEEIAHKLLAERQQMLEEFQANQ